MSAGSRHKAEAVSVKHGGPFVHQAALILLETNRGLAAGSGFRAWTSPGLFCRG